MPLEQGLGGEQGGANGIREVAAARSPDRCDMVDIDSEAKVGSHAAPSAPLRTGLRLPGFSTGSASSSGGSAFGS